MKGTAVPIVGAFGLVLAVPLIVVAVLGGGSAAATIGGPGLGLKPGTVPAPYVALVEHAGALCAAAPPSIIAAQIEQESNWNPNAVSPAGAEGISQFLPSTWVTWARPPSASPFDPAAAIPAQGRYDCAIAAQMQAWQTQGTVPVSFTLTQLMLAGYNAGPIAVLNAGGIPQNGQTPDYVTRIIALSATYSDTTGNAPGGSFAAKEIAAAQSQLGVPYSWVGGSYTGPTVGVCGPDGAENDCHIVGWDCSGLVMFAVYQASGGAIRLPHYAASQVVTAPFKAVTSGVGSSIDLSLLEAGDLIAFTNPGENVAHHIGIYLGADQMINAPQSGEWVSVAALSSGYYLGQTWTVARRS
jgi:cell wall-associated NlpC family hydrolase